jgi:hypothetical protein
MSPRVPRDPTSPVICSPPVSLVLEGTVLVVPPFRIDRLSRRFLQRSELRIGRTAVYHRSGNHRAIRGDFW